MKIPVVKEYGSWAVFIFSCTAGITTGLLTKPWQTGKSFSLEMLLTVVGLVLLINSKNPLSSLLKKRTQQKEHLVWYLFFSLTGLVLLAPVLIKGINTFLLFLPFVVSYMILLLYGKEHYLITELNGFALLTLSAPITYFVITGVIPVKLLLAVFIFFAAGVFKVKARMKKTLAYRWLMVIYCACAFILFLLFNIASVILLPLFENIISVVWMREEKLRMTGNIELIKGIIFTVLLAFYWK